MTNELTRRNFLRISAAAGALGAYGMTAIFRRACVWTRNPNGSGGWLASWPPTTAGPSARAHYSLLGEGRSRLALTRFRTGRADPT